MLKKRLHLGGVFLWLFVAVQRRMAYHADMKYLWLLTLCIVSVTNAEVYKSVDEHGRVIFSDTPRADSEVVELPDLPTYSPPVIPNDVTVDTGADQGAELPVPNYQVTITSPVNDESIRANAGDVTVALYVTPVLNAKRADQLLIEVDGREQGDLIATVDFVLSNLDRGTHTVKVSVVDNKGKILASSKSVIFHLQRYSLPRP